MSGSYHWSPVTAVTQTDEHPHAHSVVPSQITAPSEEHSLIKLNREAPTAKYTMFETVKNVALSEISRVEQPGHWEKLSLLENLSKIKKPFTSNQYYRVVVNSLQIKMKVREDRLSFSD